MAIQKQNITDQVVLFLKEQIENGIWLPGEKIDSENKLTKELEVSRASVRSVSYTHLDVYKRQM